LKFEPGEPLHDDDQQNQSDPRAPRPTVLDEDSESAPAGRSLSESTDLQTPTEFYTPSDEVTTVALGDDELESLVERRIGPYKLMREVGSGGMGSVYLAVRADDQFQKRVAIKLVRRGMDSDLILRRFRRERQILASLDHPNIARLLDGGTTEDGLPYFVMEYVEGSRLYEYADNRKLNTADRLEIFRTICSAVQYAHQNLIVHRDLKPGNILVTSSGVPKLLDFGIAKLLNPELSSETIDPTATAVRLMTPEYASPEQVRGEPITTASDVYSLGVVLYELLTGQRPYVLKDRSPFEIMRVVCEEEPQRPSTAVTRVIRDGRSTGGLVSTSATPVSTNKPRDEETERLRRRLSGDLDNIVMKALAKEPQRRYASVDQFAEDIRRHLEGLPVLARPDTFGYRASKFVQRHKASVVAAALILISLIAGIAGTTWQARKARQQRERAERRFSEGRALANAFMFELDEKIQDLPGSTEARRFLVTKSLQYLDGLVGEASGDLSLQRELASAYEKVGDVQGGNDFASMGDSAGALDSYQKAHAIREAIAAADPNSVDYRYELARSHDNLGMIFAERGDKPAGLEHHRKALEIREVIASASPFDKRAQTALATGYFHVASALVGTGDIEGAREARRKQMVIFEEVARRDDATATDRRNLALSYKYYGGMLERGGRHDEALDLYRKAVAIEEARAEQDPKNTQVRLDLSFTYASVGHALLVKNEFAASLESYRKALALREAVVAADPANVSARSYVARAHSSIGDILAETGDRAGAVESYRKALSIREAMAAGDPGSVDLRIVLADSYADLALLHSRLAKGERTPAQNRPEQLREARSWFQRSLDIFNELQSKGKLTGDDARKPENLSRELAKIEEALGKGGKK
jgi:non-specific serine/threonine protein kinase/serine/threonine-protein kinase